jgi:tetratricopeptide (TPR) repeat protein
MDDLGLGKQALGEGNRDLAISYFARYIQTNPASEEAWLCLGRCVNEPERREYCYRRVLALNPLNPEAREGLSALGVNLTGERQVEIAKQDAKDEPLRAASIDNHGGHPPSAEMPEAVDLEKSSLPAPKRTNRWVALAFGILLALLLCALPAAFYILSGHLDNYIYSYVVGWPQMPPLVSTSALTFAPTSSISTPEGAFSDRQDAAQPSIDKAKALMTQSDYSDALPIWDQVIQLVPELDDPYYEQALCYFYLTKNQRDIQEYFYYLNKTISDLDRAIAIRPDMGDYYELRAAAYTSWAGIDELRANSTYLYGIALDNSRMAYALGTTLDPSVEKNIALELVYSDHCQEALTEIESLTDKTPPDDNTRYTDLWAQGVALACLGRLDEAIQAVKASMADAQELGPKQLSEALYLYEAGRTDEAFSLINQSIAAAPSYEGDRYYLRALIYYERGQRMLAVQDLEAGAGDSWFHGGLYAYVQGRLGLDMGDVGPHAQALQVLQYSEATLGPEYNVFRERVRKELAALELEPLSTQVSVKALSTPFITLTPQATARTLALTPVETPLSNSTATTSAPIHLPDQSANTIIVDPASGTGRFTIYGYSTLLFRFQPAQTVQVKYVKSLSLRLSAGELIGPSALPLELWNPYTGGWNLIDTAWGYNQIDQPKQYVLPGGDLFVSLYNPYPNPLLLDDLSISMEVQTPDGQALVIGAK